MSLRIAAAFQIVASTFESNIQPLKDQEMSVSVKRLFLSHVA